MALMFSRLARNFAKNGYYPTDEITLERTLQALSPSPSGMRIIDPAAGEGVAIAEATHHLGKDLVQSFAVEYDKERADHSRQLVDRALHGDLMDTMISRQAFGLLWLNPPYGDLVADHSGASQYQGKGRRRLEKLFYQRCLPLLQYGGVMVFIVPGYVLDDELSGWISNHFTNVRCYAAADCTFKQVLIFGQRSRRQDLGRSRDVTDVRDRLQAIGRGEQEPDELPETWPWETYTVPPATTELQHFYRLSLEPEQFAQEIDRVRGLWPDFTLHFGQAGASPRPPVRELSRWHLALALAAGAISGVVRSKSGRVLVVKGDTYKEKVRKTEFTEDDDGNVTEVRILTDRFVPVIRAWELTPGSPNLGRVLTISSTPAANDDTPSTEPEPQPQPTAIRFPLGQQVMTRAVHHLVETGQLNPYPYLLRHAAGDWGELCDDDRRQNEQALKHGDRLFSSYDIDAGDETRLWIITEADRSSTTILLPSDY